MPSLVPSTMRGEVGNASRGACPVRQWRRFFSQGFTLIEMLVVITVIALLAALLLPALAKAKAQTSKIACINDLRQWCQAMEMYVDDSNDFIPREGYEMDGNVSWNTWAQVQYAPDAWYNALWTYLNTPPASFYAPPGKRPDFYRQQSYFHCPSARSPDRGDENAIFSRAMNSQLIAIGRAPTIKQSSIKDVSRTVLWLDNRLQLDEKVVPEQEDRYLGQPSAYADRFAGRRHLRGGNLGFVDGHVQWFPGDRVVETKGKRKGMEILPATEIVWEPDPY